MLIAIIRLARAETLDSPSPDFPISPELEINSGSRFRKPLLRAISPTPSNPKSGAIPVRDTHVASRQSAK